MVAATDCLAKSKLESWLEVVLALCMMNVTESKLVVHKAVSDSSLQLLNDDERLTQIVDRTETKNQKHASDSFSFLIPVPAIRSS